MGFSTFWLAILTEYFLRMTSLNGLWQQESVVSAKTVMVHVSHLRDKIEEATNGEKVIQTVWGVGYKVKTTRIRRLKVMEEKL